jgi:surface polysaccharide O-acyltransferase-like enzyme
MINSVQTTTRPETRTGLETRTRLERRGEVDLMRGAVVLGLIFFHTARIFDLLPFNVKNDELSLTLMALVGFVSQWGMPLMFFIAGIAAWHALAKRSTGEFAKERFLRLIIPLIFGIFVIVPPQNYYYLRTNPTYIESFWEYYPSFFRGFFKFDFPSFMNDPAHLWFLYYLFVYSMAALPLFVYLRRDAGQRFVSRLAAFCQRPGAIFLLALPIIVIEIFIPTEGTGGWNRYAYIPFLIYGYLFASDARFDQSMLRHRNTALAGGTLFVIAFFGISIITWQAGIDPTRGYEWESILWRLFKSFSSWFWIVAILGWAQRYKQPKADLKQRDGQSTAPPRHHRKSKFVYKVSRYASEAVLPFYIIHQTVLIIIGFYVVRWEAGVMVKYLTISIATFITTLVLYDLIRRTNPTRVLFGMKTMK